MRLNAAVPAVTVTSFGMGGAGACLTWGLGFLFLSEFYLKEIISSLYLLPQEVVARRPRSIFYSTLCN